jgi:ABC-type multidrug transport system fused ATPase/permease subunit
MARPAGRGAVRRVARALLPYIRPRTGRLAATLALTLGVTTMRLLEPWPLKVVIDVLFFGLPPPAILAPLIPADPDLLLAGVVGSIVAIAVLGATFFYFQRLQASALAMEATSELRVDLYSKLFALPATFHERRRTGESLMRLTGDIRALRETFVSLPVRLAESALLVLGMVGVMLLVDWRLTLAAVALAPGLVLAAGGLARPIRGAAVQQRRQEGAVYAIAAEVVRAVPVIQAFRAEEQALGRLRAADELGLQAGRRSSRLVGRLNGATTILLGLGTATVLGVASWGVLRGAITPGDLVVFLAYLRSLYKPLQESSGLLARLARATVAGERVVALLERVPAVADAPSAVRARRPRRSIALRDVSVRYGSGRPALREVSLEIAAGERVVLVGRTGSGKSTLASLIPRFLDPDEGAVLFDDADIRGFTLRSLRSHVAFLFQEPAIFAMTVAENIAYGRPDATREEIERAVEEAGIGSVVASLPEGLDTQVGDKGSRLSGGQRQCLAIARAMLRDAPVVILDEPTNGLDDTLAATVVDALERLTRGRTVLMITHDARIIREGDRVVELADGRVVGDGPMGPSTAAATLPSG